jgi:glycosyltransferase involved in cell wall biosynthesis
MIFTWLLALAVIVQLGYALYFFGRIFFLPSGRSLAESERRPVTIIICAKNESANLKKYLPLILSQEYHHSSGKPLYEVIVVNDASTDDTAEVLQQLEQQYSHLWDIQISADEGRTHPGKKYALSKGVEHAASQWLLLTDADCAPAGNRWLEMMVAPLGQGKDIVAGYGGFHTTSGVLNAFARWETLNTFMQYSTYIMAGQPYMAVGRNMACTKAILQWAQQSDVWNALPSGDDDLLVSIEGTAQNTTVVCDPAAFTYSESKTTWKDWLAQKQRHLSTGKYYREDIKVLLGLYAASHADMWVCFLLLLFLSYWKAALLLMAFRCCIYWTLWIAAAARLRERKSILLFPLFDFGWLVYNFVFLPYIVWKNKQHWK